MKLIRADLTYITKLYFHSTKVILPSIIWLLSVLLNYQVQPNYITASFLTTATVMFIVAMITTYGFFENLTTLHRYYQRLARPVDRHSLRHRDRLLDAKKGHQTP